MALIYLPNNCLEILAAAVDEFATLTFDKETGERIDKIRREIDRAKNDVTYKIWLKEREK